MDTTAPYRSLRHGEMVSWYRIERILGRGGFGVIYLATDTNLDHLVALKEYRVLAPAGSSETRVQTEERSASARQGMERFIAEARNLVKFKHPNIVRVMSVFELNTTAYIVMEFERGYDLRHHLSTGSTMSEPALKKLLIPIADGLKQVHQSGFIHRDIKPANILVRPDGSPVLLDFGSARSSSPYNGDTLTALVSVGYAPLEQYSHGSEEQQGPWSDIYALGAVLYYSVTGVEPVDSAKRGMALLNGGKDPLTPARMLANDRYSPAFLKAIDWALEFRIADRPRSLDQWLPVLLGDEVRGEDTQRMDDLPTEDPSDTSPVTQELFATDYLQDHPVPLEVQAERDRRHQQAHAQRSVRKRWIPLGLAGTALLGALLYAIQNQDNVPADEVDNTASSPTDSEQALPSVAGQGNTDSNADEPEQRSINAREPLASAEQQDVLRQQELDRQALLEQQQAEAARSREAARLQAERLATERAAEQLEATRLREAERALAAREEARQKQLELDQRNRARSRENRIRFNAALKSATMALDEGRLTQAESSLGEAAAINRNDNRLLALQGRLTRAQADARLPVSDRDFNTVVERFDQLRRAIETNDVEAMEQLTQESSQTALFRQLMSRFASLDIKIDKIRVRNADKSISATLRIDTMIRANGDRAIPSTAYRDRTISSQRREGEWSTIKW